MRAIRNLLFHPKRSEKLTNFWKTLDIDLGTSLILSAMTETQRELLSIGEFAAASRLSSKALRIYDNRGIIPPAFVDPDSGYRYYGRDQLTRARLVRLLRQMEMPLATIEIVMEADPSEVDQLVRTHATDYSARVSRVQKIMRQVLASVSMERSAMSYAVEKIQLDTQQVVSITNHVHVQDLGERIKTNINTLRAFIAKQEGEIVGPPFGIYHGTITNESDGPIEVCIPVRHKFVPSGEVVVREAAGGKAIKVVAREAQCEFPAILGAYDAAVDWIHGRGFEMAGSPREVWASKPGEDVEMHIIWLYK